MAWCGQRECARIPSNRGSHVLMNNYAWYPDEAALLPEAVFADEGHEDHRVPT